MCRALAFILFSHSMWALVSNTHQPLGRRSKAQHKPQQNAAMTCASKLGGAFANHPAMDSLNREPSAGLHGSRLGHVAVTVKPGVVVC